MAFDEHRAQPVPRTPPPARDLSTFQQSHASPLASSHSRPLASPVSGLSPSNGHAAGLLDGSSRRPMSPLTSRSLSVDSTTPPSPPASLSYSSHVNPAPAYVAPAGAAQVVSEDEGLLARSIQWSEGEGDLGSNDAVDNALMARRGRLDVRFAPPALSLVNAFLDYLLYAVLATARSTTLHALRPAVTEVLKSRLARDAIASADEELAGLLAGADEDDEGDDSADGRSSASEHDWEAELMWRRTRLRVMVYIRLGEVEDEDEERYVREDDFFRRRGRRFSHTAGLVPWAAAIFLTSVLEHVAEQTLLAAAQTALARAKRLERGRRLQMGQAQAENGGVVFVEDADVEKIALNSTMGRLWRTWRKVHRRSGPASPQAASNRFNPFFGAATDSSPIAMTADVQSLDRGSMTPDLDTANHVMAANVPFTGVDGNRDVDEFAGPGLARKSDVGESENRTAAQSAWRRTVDDYPPKAFANHADVDDAAQGVDGRPRPQRHRSSSVPPPPLGIFSVAPLSAAVDEVPGAFPTEPVSAAQDAMQRDRDVTVTAQSAYEDVPEPKSSLDDMAQYKVRPGATPQECEGVHEELPNQGDEHAEKTDPFATSGESADGSGLSAGGLGFVAAGVAAIGAGVATLVTGSKGESDGDETADANVQPNDAHQGELSQADATLVESKDDRTDAAAVAPTSYAAPAHATSRAPAAVGLASLSNLAARTNAPQYSSEAFQEATTQEPLRPRLVIGGLHDSANEHGGDTSPKAVQAEGGGYNVTQPSPVGKPRRFPARSMSPHVVSPVSRHSVSPDAARRPVSQVSAVASSPQDNMTRQALGNSLEPPQQDTLLPQRISNITKNKLTPTPSPERPIASLTSANIRGPEDFDAFVQAPEPVKYTLTPERAKDDTNSPSPSRPSTARQAMPVTPDPRASRKTTPKPATAAVTPTSSTATPPRSRSIAEIRRSASRPETPNTDSLPRKGLSTRQPRAVTESTRDFADFIRSTGPEQDKPVLPVMSKASASSFHSLRTPQLNGMSGTTSAVASRPGSSGSNGDGLRNGTARSTAVRVSPPPVPSLPTTSKSPRSMQARSATATSPGSADLIDFIRSGPDEHGKHRIPRTVAPFRTTMDSDQFRELGDPLPGEPPLPVGTFGDASRAGSIQTTSSALDESTRTSVNSRSALLANPVNTSVAPAAQSLRSVPAPSQADGRRRFRDKDPYSTAFVDEEEDDDHLTALPSQDRHEESLIEFLRNSDPPNSASARPVAAATVASPTTRTPRQSSLASSRTAAPPPSAGSTTVNANPPLDPLVARSRSALGSPSLRSPHSPLSPAPPRPRMEARSAVTSAPAPNGLGGMRSTTADLADFLKSSGPPGANDGANDNDDDGLDGGAPAPTVAKGSRLSAREAEKRRRRDEKKLREKKVLRRAASSPGSPATTPSAGGGGGSGFLSGFGMRRKAPVDVS